MKFDFFRHKKNTSRQIISKDLQIAKNDKEESLPQIYRGLQAYEDESYKFGTFDENDPFIEYPNVIKKKKKSIPPPKTPPSFFAGILCAALCILIFSGTVTFLLLFSKSGGIHHTITVPSFIDMTEQDAVKLLKSKSGKFKYEITYAENPTSAADTVISQIPKPNTVRKLYGINGKITVKLTVNKKDEPITIPDLRGLDARNVELELKNAGVLVNTNEIYSNDIPSGKIISSSHTAGSKISKGDSITLTVSLGKEAVYTDTPNLIGVSESAAITLIKKQKLSLNDVHYKPSPLPLGTVIEQSIKSGSSVREGSKISLTISGGAYSTE